MTLTDPNRSAVREKLRPVFADDVLLEAFMAELHASPSDRPVTEATLDVRLSAMEARLTERIQEATMRMLSIFLAFTTAYMAIVLSAVVALK